MDYFQPSFYHFNQDSIEFVKWIENHFKFSKITNVLDLCSGCGIIGLELLQAFPEWNIDFCELQEPFFFFFSKNSKLFFPQRSFNYFQMDLRKFNQDSTLMYELIVCNPPYFSPNKGRLPPSTERRLCRFFSEEDWNELFNCFSRSLTVEGKAYFLARTISWKENVYVKQVGSIAGAQIFCFDLNVERS